MVLNCMVINDEGKVINYAHYDLDNITECYCIPVYDNIKEEQER